MIECENAKPEHVIGKTIKDIRITDDCVEIKFTDGSEMEAKLVPVGYEGARIDSTYYAPMNLPHENAERVEINVTEYIGDEISSKTFEIGRESLFSMPKRSTARANRFVTNYLEEIIERINLPREEEA